MKERTILTQTVRPHYLNCSMEHEDKNTLITMIMIMSIYYALLQVAHLHQCCNHDSVPRTDNATLLGICLRYNETQNGLWFSTEKCFFIHTSPLSFCHNSALCQKENTLLSTFKPNIRYITYFYIVSLFCCEMHNVRDTMECTSLNNRPSEIPPVHRILKHMYYFAASKAWWKKWSYKTQIVMKTKVCWSNEFPIP